MENAKFSDEVLRRRRYSHSNKTRKEWICVRCGKTVEKGGFIEHSWTPDKTETVELCLSCVALVDEAF